MMKEKAIKISYDCENLINELVEDIQIVGLDDDVKVVLFRNKEKLYYHDYILLEDYDEAPKTDDEIVEIYPAFEALMVLVAQNEILSINKSASALKSLRLIFDYEQDEMARILGVKLDYYKDLENSTVAPNNFIIEKLKDKFKMIDSRYFID